MFSVVVPLYNKEDNIEKTIHSVLNQTFKEFELIVVNDGSTDNSVALVKKIEDDRIRIIHKKNGGVSSARNVGINEARYDWIAFLDGDDFWEPVYLEKMLDVICQYPNAGMYGSSYDFYQNGSFHPKHKTVLPNNFSGYVKDYFTIALSDILFWTSATIVSKKAIQKIGAFDERISMGEDQDVWIRMALNNDVAYYNTVLAHYNLDGVNRAMKKKIDFNRHFLCYTEKFKTWESNNMEFRSFINTTRVRYILNLLYFYRVSRDDLSNVVNIIDKQAISLKWRFFINRSFYFKKILASVYFKSIELYLFFTKLRMKILHVNNS